MQDKQRAERMLRSACSIVQSAGLHHSRAYSKLALLLDADGKGAEALPLFRLAAAADPRDANHAFNLAHHLEEMGDKDEAAEYYKKAIKLDMAHGPALSNYAALLWRHCGDKDTAVKFHQRAIRVKRGVSYRVIW